MPGGSVNLTCVAVGAPMPYVKWMMGAEELTKEDEMPVGRNVLELNNVVRSANYTCVAISSLGMIEATAQVTVKGECLRHACSGLWPALCQRATGGPSTRGRRAWILCGQARPSGHCSLLGAQALAFSWPSVVEGGVSAVNSVNIIADRYQVPGARLCPGKLRLLCSVSVLPWEVDALVIPILQVRELRCRATQKKMLE